MPKGKENFIRLATGLLIGFEKYFHILLENARKLTKIGTTIEPRKREVDSRVWLTLVVERRD